MVEDILTSLEALADAERVAFAERVFPTNLRVVGVTNPNLRLILRELKAELKSADPRAAVDTAHELLATGVLEAAWLSYELVGSKKAYQQALTRRDVLELNHRIDNWVLTDVFAANVLGYAWQTGLLDDAWFAELQSNEDVWQRRLPLVTIAAGLNTPKNGGTGDAERTVTCCARAVGDRHPMIVKAVSWALRTLIRWDREAVEDFLEAHETKLARQVVREVERKLETGKK